MYCGQRLVLPYFKTDYSLSLPTLFQALRIFKLKRETSFIIESLDTLAEINESLDQLAEAKECFEENISLKAQYFGEQHCSLSLSLHKFGCLHMKMDNLEFGLEAFKSALQIRKVQLGLNHEATVSTIIKIAEVYFRQEEYDAALKYFDQVLPIIKQLDSARDMFACNHFIGVIHYEEERFDLAATFLKQAIVLECSNTSHDIAIHDTMFYLGSALQSTGKYSEAFQFLKKGMAGLVLF